MSIIMNVVSDTGTPEIRLILRPGTILRELLEDCMFVIPSETGQHRIIIPKGFRTNFSNIPPALSGIIQYFQVDRAGIVHDFLYSKESLKLYSHIDRKEADRIWSVIAHNGYGYGYGISSVLAKIGYHSLRLFGGSYYER